MLNVHIVQHSEFSNWVLMPFPRISNRAVYSWRVCTMITQTIVDFLQCDQLLMPFPKISQRTSTILDPGLLSSTPYFQSLQWMQNKNDEWSSDLNKRLWFVTSNKKINQTFFHVIKEHLKFHHNHTWNLSLLVLLELVWSWICRKVVWILKNTPGSLMFKTLVMFTHLDIKVTAPRHVFWSVVRKIPTRGRHSYIYT